ncbi:MAG: GxxExxY protein, partial [Desulfococcaceae bacterium]
NWDFGGFYGFRGFFRGKNTAHPVNPKNPSSNHRPVQTQKEPPIPTKPFKYAETTQKIIGCAMEVHRTLGTGFQEVIYQRALFHEFQLRGVHFKREYEMEIFYKNHKLGTRRVDFLVENRVSVEIKVVSALNDIHLAQAINYIEVSGLEVGLLLNFGAKSLEFRRIDNRKKSSPSR